MRPATIENNEEHGFRRHCIAAALVACALLLTRAATVRGEAIELLPPVEQPQLGADANPSTPLAANRIAASEPTGLPSTALVDNQEPPATPLERLADLEDRFDEMTQRMIEAAQAPEEFPTFRITGFTQLDGGWYQQTPKNEQQVGDAQDAVGFRRVRLGVVGKVSEFTNYMVELDFATAGRPSFFDIWVEQGNIPYFGTVRGGQYCQPFSVDALTGFRNLTFLERSLPFLAFVPFRRVGVMAYNGTEDARTNWAVSGFKTGGFNNAPLGDDRFGIDLGDVGGWSFTGRATHLLYFDEHAADRYVWHVGASYDYSMMSANTAAGSTSPVPFYQARTTPEFGPLGYTDQVQNFGQAFAYTPVFVDTGKYAADHFNLFGVETLYQAGPFGFTSEWMGSVVQSSTAGPIFYHGAYGQVAYRLTGENRLYDRRTGTLGKVVPFTDFISLTRGRRGVHGWGAWEVAARLSYVSLHNPANLVYLPGSNGYGQGTLTDTTLGMTWFLNTYLKLQFNWIHAMLENTGYPAAPTPGVQATRGFSLADLYVTRLQVDF
ncbi:MAG TPA: porin [Pirellulales bacterium]|jgi:phosphate-selective porin OprO/OprP|nr:porin [Pirellulales bacterium]